MKTTTMIFALLAFVGCRGDYDGLGPFVPVTDGGKNDSVGINDEAKNQKDVQKDTDASSTETPIEASTEVPSTEVPSTEVASDHRPDKPLEPVVEVDWCDIITNEGCGEAYQCSYVCGLKRYNCIIAGPIKVGEGTFSNCMGAVSKEKNCVRGAYKTPDFTNDTCICRQICNTDSPNCASGTHCVSWCDWRGSPGEYPDPPQSGVCVPN